MLARLPDGVPVIIGRTAAWIERRRAPVAAIAFALIIVGIASVLVLRSASGVALFDAPLHADQIAEVTNALTLWGEPHTAAPGSDQIFVPAARRQTLLLRLTLAGIPHAHVPTSADEIAEPISPLAPSALVDDRRRLGLEGDLVAALRRISDVEDASVFITPAAGDIAALGDPPQTSAAVQIVARPGASLAPAAVNGIRNLVASAVPGLSADRVAVTDADGKLLKDAPQQDTTIARESRLQSSVQSALDAVFGAGAAVVRVRVITAGSVYSSQSTRVTPHGLLDADAGLEHGADGGRAFDKERHVQHYAYDTVVEHRSSTADVIRRITVAVFLDARRVDANRRNDVAALVRAAAGADLGSGDDVVVGVLPFAAALPIAAAPPATAAPHGRLAIAAVTALAALVLTAAGACWPRFRAGIDVPAARPTDCATAIGEVIGAESPRTAAYVLNGMPAAIRSRVLAGFDDKRRLSIEEHLTAWRDDG
ncbi:MAG TPA: flagellar M-ring protein FliF C-terminal domain-containing protein [Candidatus Eremiobacteraceae bacterium]|nr:flagellar M-ring protein FliF C-terminal domain-containing protein [Candidatus Eremiobacteraceae bacterium]